MPITDVFGPPDEILPMTARLPVVALIVYPNFSPFHVSVPYLIFNTEMPEGGLFDLRIVSSDARPLAAERAMTVQPDGGLELVDMADIVVVPGWHDLNVRPDAELVAALVRAHARG